MSRLSEKNIEFALDGNEPGSIMQVVDLFSFSAFYFLLAKKTAIFYNGKIPEQGMCSPAAYEYD